MPPSLRQGKREVLTPRKRSTDATIQHRKVMDRVLDRTATEPLKAEIRKESAILRKLLYQNVGSSSRPASKADLAVVRQHLNHSLLRVGRAAGTHLVGSTRETQVEAVRSLAKFAHVLSPQKGTALDDEHVVRTVVSKHRKALETGRRNSAAALTQNMRIAARDELRGLSLEGMTVKQLVKRAHAIAAGQWWQVERTIRTENSIAFNTTQHTALKEMADDVPGLMMRWTEMINDITGMPMDNRVAKDSMVLHGQVTRPGSMFVMPPHPLAPSKMVGKMWAHPPNRPNDRAVLTPWIPGDGVPAWQWVNGRRVNLK